MPIKQVADIAIRGIRNNSLYIITHGEYRFFCQERFDRIMGAFAETPVSKEYDPNKALAGTREWANDPECWGNA